MGRKIMKVKTAQGMNRERREIREGNKAGAWWMPLKPIRSVGECPTLDKANGPSGAWNQTGSGLKCGLPTAWTAKARRCLDSIALSRARGQRKPEVGLGTLLRPGRSLSGGGGWLVTVVSSIFQ